MVTRRALVFGSLVSLVALAGCKDPYGGRQAVSGTVKLQRELLKNGSITFVPLDKQDTQSGAAVTNGEYKVPRQNGLKPGKYLVQITAGDGKTPANAEAGNPGGSTNIVSFDLIPEDWNVRSKQQVEVKSSGPNKFDFDIPHVNARKKKS